MRVGLVVPGFSSDQSDWCIPALRHLAGALAEHDEVRVISVRYPYRPGRYAIDGVDVLALGGADRTGAATARVWQSTLGALQSEHRRRPFDILHAFWATESGMLSAIGGRLLGVPTVVSLAGGELVRLPDIGYGDQRSIWERLKVRTSLRVASLVTAGSQLLLGLATRHVAAPKLRHAPLGVPLARFSPGRQRGHGLVHVGALVPVKDHATLLRAFKHVRQSRPDLVLRVVGDGPLRPTLEHFVDGLGLKSAVQFVGDVDHAALPTIYRAAAALVVSSRHEAQCMVALEAAACGVALAGTRVGVIPEIAAPDAITDVGHPESLAHAMLGAVGNPCTPPDIADFSLETCTNRFRDLYVELAGSRA